MGRRTTPKAEKAKALDKALKGMFGRLERRPVPDELLSTVDQLEAAEKALAKKKASSR